MLPASSAHDLKVLIQSFHPLIAIDSVEEERVIALVGAAADALRLPYFEWSVTRGLVRPPSTTGITGTAEPVGLLKHLGTLEMPAVFCLLDFAGHLAQPAIVRRFRELVQSFTNRVSTVILTGSGLILPPEIEHLAVRYRFELPGREELDRVVRSVVRSLGGNARVRVELQAAEHENLVRALMGMTANQARQAVAYAALQDGRLSVEDIETVRKRKAALLREGGVLEFYPVEDNQSELGGFARLKSWLEQARIGFTPEARALNLTAPRGIMLVGVQGCGKSLAAKAIGRQWGLPLLKLDAGRLLDKYIGESEKNFARAIAMAESMAPAVLWIDEIEKCLVASGSGDADAGVGRRLFGAFLTWLQEKRAEVFVVATANDLSLVPPELLRKGRFDEIFFVDLPDATEREEIFAVHLRLRKQDPARFELPRLVEATEGFSGAEIEQGVIAGLYRSLSQKRPLDTEIVLEQMKQTIPLSVSRAEDVTRLRDFARERFVGVR